MALRRFPGCKVWHYQCRIGGKSWCRSTGETNKRKAAEAARVLQRQARLLRTRGRGSSTLLPAIVAEVERVEMDVGAREAQRVSQALTNFFTFAGNVALDRISSAMVETFQRRRLESVSTSTINKELSYLLRLLRLRGYAVQRPPAKRRRETQVRNITADEARQFFAACPEPLRLMYAMMYYTGARMSEIVPSEKSDHIPLLKTEVDLEACRLNLRTGKGHKGKRREVRRLSFPEELREPLRRQIESTEEEFVFPPFPNGGHAFDHILRATGIAKRNAAGEVLRAHSFRHAYGTGMAERVSPFEVQKLLGHASLQTTQRYVHIQAPDVTAPITIEFETREKKACEVVDVPKADAS
jgi:integrase